MKNSWQDNEQENQVCLSLSFVNMGQISISPRTDTCILSHPSNNTILTIRKRPIFSNRWKAFIKKTTCLAFFCFFFLSFRHMHIEKLNKRILISRRLMALVKSLENTKRWRARTLSLSLSPFFLLNSNDGTTTMFGEKKKEFFYERTTKKKKNIIRGVTKSFSI